MGLPLQKSLPLVADKLAEYGLKERIVLISSSKMIEPSIIAWALCMGADYVVSARRLYVLYWLYSSDAMP